MPTNRFHPGIPPAESPGRRDPGPAQHTSTLLMQEHGAVMGGGGGNSHPGGSRRPRSGSTSGLGKDRQAHWPPSLTGQHGKIAHLSWKRVFL